MENRTQQNGMDSVHDVRVFSNVLFVTVAAMLAAAGVWLLSGMGMSQMALHGAGRIALAVTVLGFSGVLASTLVNLPDTMRRTLLLLFATALLCSGFVALAWWFAVSGASSWWL